ncbi:MAG: DUF2478 domain-containing protein [Rhizobiales bacterium]|nr:DUF2478 domain-containing protein [Hyphomicrobiales bacterium]
MSELAAIRYLRGHDIDGVLGAVCRELRAHGLSIGGLLQVSTGDRGGTCAATTVVVDLRTGEEFNIWQDRGPCATACRLDEGGLSLAEPALQKAIEARVDLLVINRFGRAESVGRGLRPYFEAALSAGVPVLTAVREPYDADWRAFHGGLGCEIACDVPSIVAWAVAAGKAGAARGAARPASPAGA